MQRVNPWKARITIQKLSAFIFAIAFYSVAVAINIYDAFVSIGYSSSSTASIGYIFAPFYALIYALPWLMVGYSVDYGVKARASKNSKDLFIALLGGVVSLGYVGYSTFQFLNTQHLTETIISIQKMNTDQLDTFVSQSNFKDNKFALGAVCLNHQASSITLAKIAARKDPELYKRMWAKPEIMGKNRKGFAVMRLIVFHPNVTGDILTELSMSTDPYVLGSVARSDKTPERILQNIFSKKNNFQNAYLIEWGLSRNMKTPVNILESLANSRNKYTLRKLKSNRSTPSSMREIIIERLEKKDYD